MIIKDVFIELRARLRSCNVFITTTVKLNEQCHLKINIQTGCINLDYSTFRRNSLSSIESLSDSEEECMDVETIVIDEFCQLIPNSMSCLKISGNNISFRILTRPKDGDFYTEIVSTEPCKEPKAIGLKINLASGVDTRFSCANCSNVVSADCVKFDRVLELPTTSLDASDWFCHGHDNCQLDTRPKTTDFLYRLTHFVINSSALSPKINNFNSKRAVYHCNRCLSWLGLKERNSIKLFNSEVIMRQNETNCRVFSHNTQTDVTIDDFIYTIESLTRESNMGMQFSVMCRVVLECEFGSGKRYLLVWVMDKQLEVLRNQKGCECDRVVLQSSFLTKILYKVEDSLNEEVESWLADPSVVSADISKAMFCKGIEHLSSTSQKVPESFRNVNGYCVSYLKV